MRNTSAYCNQSLSYYARAEALVATANLTEQIDNLGVSQPGFPREDIPTFSFGEALHGVCQSCGKASSKPGSTSTGCATSFPHATALGATFNRTLWTLVGDTIGLEGRAFQNTQNGGGGVMYFAPNVNLCRDPRWGRCMEVPGEDPLTTGEYGALFVKAMQARAVNGSQRVVNAPKHWLDYDLEGRHTDDPSGIHPSRGDFNAVISEREQTEYYLAQWHATMAIGQPGGVMCSTNRINGVDACMNGLYFDILRGDAFNFSGFVLTDGGSCGNPNCKATVALHNASAAKEWKVKGHEIAAELCVSAGTDMELGTTLTLYAAGAVEAGMLRADEIARSNARVYAQIIAQGHLETVAADSIGTEVIDTARSRQLAFDAATQAMVLLKNDGGMTLPLRKSKTLKIALIGPHLNSTDDLLASRGYAGENKHVLNNTIEKAFRRRAEAGECDIVGTAGGCNIVTGCTTSDLASVEVAVANADIILAFVGLHPSTGESTAVGYGTNCSEGEAWDRRDSIDLCGEQPAILSAAVAKSGKNTPLITVLINGGQISATWIKDHSAAVLEAWYPGQAGGEAIAAVVFGDASPGGRLPVTFYDDSFVKSRNITEMGLRTHDGLTYMHWAGGPPLWEFGFGLAYTNWSLSLGSTSSEQIATTAELAAAYGRYYTYSEAGGLDAPPLRWLNATVRNTGTIRSEDVIVHVFATLQSKLLEVGAPRAPLRQLVGFAREANIAPGETRTVSVGLAPLALCTAKENGDHFADPATWKLFATTDGTTMVESSLLITGPPVRVFAWPNQSETTRSKQS